MILLQEIDFSNRDFWVGYMATSFPTAWEEETDMSLTELMIENGMCDTGWWDNFTKYYDGVLEESDGYVDEPETLICELAPAQTLNFTRGIQYISSMINRLPVWAGITIFK